MWLASQRPLLALGKVNFDFELRRDEKSRPTLTCVNPETKTTSKRVLQNEKERRMLSKVLKRLYQFKVCSQEGV